MFLFALVFIMWPFFSYFVCFNTICWHFNIVARVLALDVCFLLILVMYIDLGSDLVIWTVNWLRYLNYEAVPCRSSNFHPFIQGTSLGQTVSSYICFNVIPHAVPIFGLFGEHLRVWPSFSRIIRQASMCFPHHTVYVTVMGFVCSYVCKTFSKGCSAPMVDVSNSAPMVDVINYNFKQTR